VSGSAIGLTEDSVNIVISLRRNITLYVVIMSVRNAFYLIFQAELGPRICPRSNRNDQQRQKKTFLRSGGQPVNEADNLAAICEQTV
jgi:hypothetical protein